MDNELILKRKRRFMFIVRFMYLLSFGLIGSGLYINYIEEIVDRAGLDINTDYNFFEKNSDYFSNQDEFYRSPTQSLTPLTSQRVEELLAQIPLADKEVFARIDQQVEQVESLKDLNSYTVKRDGEKLENILKIVLADINPEASLNAADLKNLLRSKQPPRKTYSKDTVVYYSLTEDGNINYFAYPQDVKTEYRYIKNLNTGNYIEIKDVKPTSKRDDVITVTVGKAGMTAALKDIGVSDGAIKGMSAIFNWKLKDAAVPVGATIRVVATREYLEGKLVSSRIFSTKAAKLTIGKNNYYAIEYRNGKWYDEKGLAEEQITFQRTPFNRPHPITSKFNPARRNPVTGRISPHKGIDFGIPKGTPIVAPADGEVVRSTYQANGAGNYLVIKHGKTYETVYMHLTRAVVTPGQKVRQGQLIAYSGNTGRSTGPHLHYELHRNGTPVDPLKEVLPQAATRNVANDRRFKSLANVAMSRLDQR